MLGEDYGEGSSIIQERSHAFAMKSQIWLLDPRPNLPKIVEMVEQGFELSEASSTPVMLELRIRACHVQGSFKTKNNQAPQFSKQALLENPDFDYGRICLPPATYAQEKHKIDVRWPAAVSFIREQKLNELFAGEQNDIGILCQGGMYNAVIRALQTARAGGRVRRLASADLLHERDLPADPGRNRRVLRRTRNRVLIVEEGQPAYIEDAVLAALRRAGANEREGQRQGCAAARRRVHRRSGADRVSRFLGRAERVQPIVVAQEESRRAARPACPRARPGFCVGCPERPVFSAMKVLEKETGKFHLSADIGCHLFSTLPPFNIGNTVLGYGLGLASNSAVQPMFGKRTVTHDGRRRLLAQRPDLRHRQRRVQQERRHPGDHEERLQLRHRHAGAALLARSTASTSRADMSIERALEGIGVGWVKTVDNYRVGEVAKTLKEAMTTDYTGLKVIIAEGECQLERQRKLRPRLQKS